MSGPTGATVFVGVCWTSMFPSVAVTVSRRGNEFPAPSAVTWTRAAFDSMSVSVPDTAIVAVELGTTWSRCVQYPRRAS